ncbi:MAG: family 10 glycosylhydrolase, partial [Phormidesmis sp.]
MVKRLFSIRPRKPVKRDNRPYIYGGAVCGLAGLAFGAIAPILTFAQTIQIESANELSVAADPPPAKIASVAPAESENGLSQKELGEQAATKTASEVVEVASAISKPAVRSIWLDRETIVNAGSVEGLAQIFDRFKAAGINTVFVETVNAGYPIYESAIAPEKNPLIKGWDPLQAAIDLGKRHDMEIHAWVWLFAAGNQAHNRIVGLPNSYPGPILSANP